MFESKEEDVRQYLLINAYSCNVGKKIVAHHSSYSTPLCSVSDYCATTVHAVDTLCERQRILWCKWTKERNSHHKFGGKFVGRWWQAKLGKCLHRFEPKLLRLFSDCFILLASFTPSRKRTSAQTLIMQVKALVFVVLCLVSLVVCDSERAAGMRQLLWWVLASRVLTLVFRVERIREMVSKHNAWRAARWRR